MLPQLFKSLVNTFIHNPNQFASGGLLLMLVGGVAAYFRGVTLSGVLNALDGIETPHGSLFFLTTNLIEKLDDALLRPGRIDKKIYLGPATDEQKLEMFHRFFPQECEKWENAAEIFLYNHPELKTMAEFQEALKIRRSES